MSKARDLASQSPTPSTVSATELGYLDGVSSAIQTQIDGKEATLPSQTGNSGKYLTTNGSTKSWGTPVTSVTGTTGRVTVTGTGTPAIDLDVSGATAGTYGSSTTIPQLAVDAYGRVTSISNAGLTASSAMTFIGTQTATNGGITFSSIPTHKSLRMYVSQVNTSTNPNVTQMRINGITTATYGTIQNTFNSTTGPNYATYFNPAGGSLWSQQDSAFTLGSVQNSMGNIHYVIDFINSGFATARKFITAITHGQGNTGTLFPTQSYMVQSTADLVVTSISFGTNWAGTGSIRADLFAIA